MVLKEKDREKTRFIEVFRDHPRGLTIEEISRLLPLNRNATSKYLNRMLISGQVEMKAFGPAKVFFISKRLPISQLLNLSSDLILILDHDMFVRLANDRLVDIFQIQREDLISHQIDHTHFGSCISPEFRKNITDGENGNETVFEEKIAINGLSRHFYTKCVPVVFEDGERGVSVILRDITVSEITR